MAETAISAVDWTYELNTGTTASPVWVEVERIHTMTHAPRTAFADTTTNDDGGEESHIPVKRGDDFTLVGKRWEDTGDGSRPAGQAAVEAWAALFGAAALKEFRITSPGGEVKTFQASAQVTSSGGGQQDASEWSVMIKRSGPITVS